MTDRFATVTANIWEFAVMFNLINEIIIMVGVRC